MPSLINYSLANNRYQILSLLREGGMGTVYYGIDHHLEREVAVKIIARDLADQPSMREQFKQEARIIAQLEHPNILPIYDSGYDETLERNFIVMKLVKAGTLKDRFDKPLALPWVVDMVRLIANGLSYAHDRDVLHCDIKPSNILIDQGDWPLITDFGLARLMNALNRSNSGEIFGTIHYMSPEQCLGQPLDPRTDVYSLGIVIFEMLTGRPPFEGDNIRSIISKHISEDVPFMAEVDMALELPIRVEEVVRQALAKNRDERYSTPQGLARAFDIAVTQSLVEARANDLKPEQIVVAPVTKSTSPWHVPKGFVDRREQWSIIKERLDLTLQRKPTGNQIFQFYGTTGIGKTTLLQAFANMCAGANIQHAFVDLSQYTQQTNSPRPIAIIEKLLDALNKPSLSSDDYDTDMIRDSVSDLTYNLLVKELDKYNRLATQRSRLGKDVYFSNELNDSQEKITREFSHYLRILVLREPVVFIFDGLESITPEVQTWLEQLIEDMQSNPLLTLIFGGRRCVQWRGRIEHYAAVKYELTLFTPNDTIEHWKTMLSNPPYSHHLGEFVHQSLTYGHPSSNVLVARRLKEHEERQSRSGKNFDAGQTLSDNWSNIVADLAKSTLNDLISNHPEKARLQAYARLLAPLRNFDRHAARALFTELRPDLLPSERQESAIENYLLLLVKITLLSKDRPPFWLYQMQPIIRSFITADLSRNTPNEYERAIEVVRNHYSKRVEEADLADFLYIIPELLYYEAEFHLVRGDTVQKDDAKLEQELTAKLTWCLQILTKTVSAQRSRDMLERLTYVLKDDVHFREKVGYACFDKLISLLTNFETSNSQPVLEITTPQTPTESSSSISESSKVGTELIPTVRGRLRDLLAIAVIAIVCLLALGWVFSVLIVDTQRWLALVSPWLLFVFVLIVVYLALTGHIKSDALTTLLTKIVDKIPGLGGLRANQESQLQNETINNEKEN